MSDKFEGQRPCPLCNGYAQLRHGKKYAVTTQSYHDDTEYRLPASIYCKDCSLSVSWSVDISEYKHINDAFNDVAKRVSEKWNNRPGERLAKIEVLEELFNSGSDFIQVASYENLIRKFIAELKEP